MKRPYRITGAVFLVVVIPGGLVALYEMHRAEREERIREQLRESQETQQALREDNKNLNLRLREMTKQLSDRDKKAQEIDRDRRKPGADQDTPERPAEEMRGRMKEDQPSTMELIRRINESLEQIRKLREKARMLPPLPGEIEPRRRNPIEEREQDVPHPDATKNKRRTFS